MTLFTQNSLACDLTQYVFKDQRGLEAKVVGIYECFGWYNRDSDETSKECLREQQVYSKMNSSDANIRMTGSRVYQIVYQSIPYWFSEEIYPGVPWYYQGVDQSVENFSSWKEVEQGELTKMLTGEDVEFDFTLLDGLDRDAKELYGPLMGLKFVFKRCE